MKKMLCVIMLLFSLVGCSAPPKEETTKEEITSAAVTETSREKETEASESPMETTTSKAESDGGSSMVNPMKAVESSKDFETIGISLYLPEDLTTAEDVAYYIINNELAEIKFFDTVSQSLSIVRAANKELGDVSGLYYNFDEGQTQTFEEVLEDGSTVPITVKVVVDGTDIHGALATWAYGDVNYFLWQDNGKKEPALVGELAGKIMRASLN